MGKRLDELLAQTPEAPASALERARAAARAELGLKRPIRRWTTELRWTLLATWGTVLIAAAVTLALGLTSWELLVARANQFIVVAVAGLLCAFAALSPKASRTVRGAAVVMAALGGLFLVAARQGPAGAVQTTEWICTVSHLALGIPPLLLIVAFLRNAAPGRLRATVAGLAVGTTGALVGELVCAQSGLHVAAYHLTAWALVGVAAVVTSGILRPRAYAP